MSSENSKPDCYKCIYRGEVSYDHHSFCGHPAINDPILTACGLEPLPFRVIGNRHGLENGWFVWPVNYDPIWLEECAGFTPKKEEICETSKT